MSETPQRLEIELTRKLIRRLKRRQRATEAANRQDQRDHGNPFRFGDVQAADAIECLLLEAAQVRLAKLTCTPRPETPITKAFLSP